jgi:tetratricopeptide (TPR) repeat protein
MLEEAEALLLTISPGSEWWHDAAQEGLCQIYQRQHRNEDIVRIGRALIARGRHTIAIVENTMVALTFLGRHREARETLELVEGLGRPLARNAYQMACFSSLEGNFSDALRWLEIEARQPFDLSPRSIGDSDLLPLWRWLANDLKGLDDAHRLIRLPLQALAEQALDPRQEIEMDQNDLKAERREIQRLFKHSQRAGMSVLHPLAVAKHPREAAAFCKARHEHIAMIAGLLGAGYRRAFDLVLDAQPRYSAEQAAWGNQLGVRYHLTWTLARRPKMLSAFRAERGLESMMPLIKSFEAVLRVDPDFYRRMERVSLIHESAHDEAWQTLEETPALARQHPLFTLRQALLYTAEGDHRRALPIYRRLCELWPADAAGFANVVLSLMSLGEWEEAARRLIGAPDYYRRFRLFHLQCENVEKRSLSRDGSTAIFNGQRDWGVLAGSAENEEASR